MCTHNAPYPVCKRGSAGKAVVLKSCTCSEHALFTDISQRCAHHTCQHVTLPKHAANMLKVQLQIEVEVSSNPNLRLWVGVGFNPTLTLRLGCVEPEPLNVRFRLFLPPVQPRVQKLSYFRFLTSEAILSDFFFFCARESSLVYFWCLRCFILF